MLALWLKAFHIFFVVSWFAGLFYLPRLFVHHKMCGPGDEAAVERLKIMERKLYRFMTPIGVLVLISGTWLTVVYGMAFFTGSPWLHAKLVLVAFLVGYHAYCGVLQRQLADDRCSKSHVWFRVFNELPTLVLLAVIVLVIVKPF
jgi:putative membrane protein